MWLSISEAAARLGKSERTLRRHVASGRMETQQDEAGHTLIFVEAPDVSTAPAGTDDHISTALALAGGVTRHAEAMSTAAQREAARARRSGLIAWGVALALTGGAGLGAFLLETHHRDTLDGASAALIRAEGEADHLAQRLEDQARIIDRLRADQAGLVRQLADVQARAELNELELSRLRGKLAGHAIVDHVKTALHARAD